jgi:hypothetical protein
MAGAPTGAIDGPVGAPVASAAASPGTGGVVTTAGTGPVVVLGLLVASGPLVPVGLPLAPPWRRHHPPPSPLWSGYVSWSAIRTEATRLIESCAMVVVGGAGVVGGGTSTVAAGELVAGAGTLEATGPATVTRTSAAWADAVVVLGGAAVAGTCVAALSPTEPPAASNRVPLAASRSSLKGAGESRAERARKVVVDAEVSPRLACCRASGAAIRAWWTA